MDAVLQLNEAQVAEIAEKVASLTEYSDGLLQEKIGLQQKLQAAEQRVRVLEGEKINLEKVASAQETLTGFAKSVAVTMGKHQLIAKEAAMQAREHITADNALSHLQAMFKHLIEKSATTTGPGSVVFKETFTETPLRPADPHGDFSFLYK